jgi:hypothetical protein
MFRFTIRDMLWLTVVVALALGWWLDNSFEPNYVIPMFPHEMSSLCKPGEMIKVTVSREGYDAESMDGSQTQSVRTQVTRW